MKKLSMVHRRVLDDAQADIGALYRTFHISEQGYNEEQVEKAAPGTEKMFCRGAPPTRFSTGCGGLLSIPSR